MTQKTQLTATKIRELYLRGLQDKAEKGEALTRDEWQRLSEHAEAEKPNPLSDVLTRLGEHTKKSKRITKQVAELAKLALLAEQERHIWPDAARAAGELKTSVQTIRDWCNKFEIEHERCPIAKVDLIRALWQRAEEKFDKHKSAEDQREQQLRTEERELRIAAKRNTLEDAANFAAHQTIIRLLNDISGDIFHNWPPQITNINAEAQTKDAMQLQGHYHRFFKNQIAHFIDRILEDIEHSGHQENIDTQPDPQGDKE